MAPRPLRVPLIHQPWHKPYCGAASGQMVLAYHGIMIPQRRIVRDMRVTETKGVDMLKMSLYFLRLGFEVTLVGWFKDLPHRLFRMKGDALRDELIRWSRRRTKSGTRRRSWPFAEFFRLGGRYEPRPVTAKDLHAAIARREPPILNLDVATLWGLPHRQAGHYVVPIRVRGGKITVRDPNRNHGGTKTYPLADVLHACYRWSAGALFVRPKP